MTKPKESKRENFEVSPEQQAEIETLQELIAAPSKKDAVLMAVHVALHLAVETKKGNQIFVGLPGQKDLKRIVMLGIEKPSVAKWMYLVEQAHPWKKQLYVKGSKLPAAAVWSSYKVNKLTVEEAMDNWDLPAEAIREIIEYCESNQKLLKMEAAEELRRLEEKGIRVAVKTSRR